jgi:hypothetical protein
MDVAGAMIIVCGAAMVVIGLGMVDLVGLVGVAPMMVGIALICLVLWGEKR